MENTTATTHTSNANPEGLHLTFFGLNGWAVVAESDNRLRSVCYRTEAEALEALDELVAR